MKKRNLTGMTLMELIMVMIIVGVVSALTLPKIIIPDTIPVRTGISLVRSDIRYAVDYALNTGKPVKIRFITSGNTGYKFWEKSEGVWQLLTRPAVSTTYEVVLGKGDYRGLSLTDVNINGGKLLFINSLGIPLDNNRQPLIEGMSSYVTLNNMGQITIEPVTCKVN